jgi:hypothetical protein
VNRCKNAHRDRLRDVADTGVGLVKKKRSASSGFAGAPDLYHGESQIGGDFFERDSLVVSEPLFGSGDGVRFLFALRLFVDGSIADWRHVIGQDFQAGGRQDRGGQGRAGRASRERVVYP